MYVDNLITGTDTIDNANDIYSEAKEAFSSASMYLRGWSSNSNEFMDSIPDDDKDTQTTNKILGLKWNTRDDTLQVTGLQDMQY